MTHGHFASSTARTRAAGSTVAAVVTSPPPDVFGQRAPDQIAVVVSGERLERVDSHSWFRHRLDGRERELRLLDVGPKRQVADVRRRLEILRGGRERLETLRQHGALDDRLHRPLLQRLDPANLAKRRARLREHLHRVSVVAADRRHDFLRRRPRCALCTEPGRHHDHTSSVTNGRYGANSRSSVDSATSIALFADAAPSGPEVAVAAPLHQLEVVVAERPEEALGLLEHARVVVRLELLGRLVRPASTGS